MAATPEKPASQPETDLGYCEYVPFGEQESIKLSFSLIRRWLAVRTAKGAMPSEHDIMDFLMECKAGRLNPYVKDAFLIGYDGKDGPVFSTVVAHQAFLKRAETHPEFDGMESGVIVDNDGELEELTGDFFPPGNILVGGWASVFFKNRRHPMKKTLRLATFNRGFGVWKTNPEGMIVKCAEADALRSSFPQLIGGMYLREEMGTGSEPSAAAGPRSLEDRRAEELVALVKGVDRDRVFTDRSGSPVNGGKASRYEQDAAAADVAQRIRPKPAADPGTHEEMRSVDGDLVDIVPNETTKGEEL